MIDAHPPYGPKKATNVSINKELLMEAKALGINLSATLEAGLRDAVRRHKREQWLAENSDAIEAYNEHIKQNGLFSDGRRQF